MKKISAGALSRTIAAVMLAIATASIPAPVRADDPATDGHSVYDTVIYWGFDYSRARSSQYGIGADAGFVSALNGDISQTGWTVSGNIGGSRSVSGLSSTNSAYGSVLVGYQWHMPGYYIALNAGIDAVNNNEKPGGSKTDGSKLGAIVQYGFETKSVDAFYLQSYGSFSTAFTRLYGHAKVGYKTSDYKFGAEFTGYKDSGSAATYRVGGFFGDIPLGPVTMGVSAGLQLERGIGLSNGFYGLLEFSVPISIH